MAPTPELGWIGVLITPPVGTPPLPFSLYGDGGSCLMSSCLMCVCICASSGLQPVEEELLPFGLMGIDLKAPPEVERERERIHNEQLLQWGNNLMFCLLACGLEWCYTDWILGTSVVRVHGHLWIWQHSALQTRMRLDGLRFQRYLAITAGSCWCRHCLAIADRGMILLRTL